MGETRSRASPGAAPPDLPRLARYAEHGVALMGAAGVAAAYGWDYAVDNQTDYLLGSLRLLDPSVLARDWFTTRTTHYHAAYKYLGAALIGLSRQGMAVALAAQLCVVVGLLSCYALLRIVAGRRAALPAFLGLLVLVTMTRTSAAGSAYVFDHILQPSTLASAALLAAVPFFANANYVASGACVGVAGMFHGNFLVLLYGACIGAQLALGWRGLGARLAQQLLFPTLVLLSVMPLIVRTAGAPQAARAQEIWITIRAPHHYNLAGFERHFEPFVAWHLVGLGALGVLASRARAETRRAAAIVAGLLAVIWGGIGLSALFHVRQATQLFSWRIAPHAALVLQTLALGAAARAALDGRSARRLTPAGLAAVACGIGLLCLYYGDKNDPDVPKLVLVAAFGALGIRLIAAALARLAPGRVASVARRVFPPLGRWALAALFAYVLYGRGSLAAHDAIRKSTVLNGLPRIEAELVAFMHKGTPKDAMFLSPPDAEWVRFHGQRAIVVDWKSAPIVPSQVLEWYRRIVDVTGRQKFAGLGDLRGYDTLDDARLKALVEKYAVDYVLVRRGREKTLASHPIVFKNSKYVVLDARRVVEPSVRDVPADTDPVPPEEPADDRDRPQEGSDERPP